jgi:hypothetical protein
MPCGGAAGVGNADGARDRREDLHAENVVLGGEQVGVARFAMSGNSPR